MTLTTDPGVPVSELTLAPTPQPLLREARDIGPQFSGSSPDFLCRLPPGGKGAVRKAPRTTRSHFRRAPTLGSASAGWGGGAGPAPLSRLPPSFIPKEIVGSLEEAGHSLG